jgi:PPOX class probable FMN-dependent enzyme
MPAAAIGVTIAPAAPRSFDTEKEASMPSHPFVDLVTTREELREITGEPSELVIKKQLDRLDEHTRRWIAFSPFALVSSASAAGRCDVSPRGDAPGFVRVIDDATIAIPERPSNRRADTMLNVLENPRLGMIFIIPGLEETLRVNGRAAIARDAELLASMEHRGKIPKLAIVVEVEEVYFHCAKAFKRSALWNSETWPDKSALPSLARVLVDQVRDTGLTVEAMECSLEESYRTRLY